MVDNPTAPRIKVPDIMKVAPFLIFLVNCLVFEEVVEYNNNLGNGDILPLDIIVNRGLLYKIGKDILWLEIKVCEGGLKTLVSLY